MKKLILLALTCVASVASYAADNANYDALYEQISFDMPKVTAPVFPNYQVNIKDFGAVGDGSSLCTEAFARDRKSVV